MNTLPSKNAIIYCRVSTTDQVENTSLEHQERVCRDYANSEGLQVVKVFIDGGKSAKTTDRKEFKEATLFCQKNKVGFFIVYKLDRFARNQEDHFTVRAVLSCAGTKLRSATEPINDSPVGKAMEGMVSVFAEFDNNVRTERTKDGMLERVKEGIWMWPCPIGYYRPHKGGNIVPDQELAPLVRLAFEEYAKGTYTYRSLAKFLTQRGFRSRHGREPGPQQIEKVLSNKVYCGFIDVWGGYKGTFEPIVSEHLFNECQRIKSGDTGHASPRSTNNPEFPLRGSVQCSECGTSLTGSSSTGRVGKKYPYYHHHRIGCSKSASIPKATFEQLFVEHLEAITPDPSFERLFKVIVLDVWKQNYQGLDKQNESLRRDIKRLEADRQRVFELHQKDEYTYQEFIDQKKRVNDKIDAKQRLINENVVDGFDMDTALNNCFAFVRKSATIWLKSDYQTKIQLQRAVYPKPADFDGQRFGTTNLSLIYQLGSVSPVEKNTLVALVRKRWNRVVRVVVLCQNHPESRR